jgi:hypothetical protein
VREYTDRIRIWIKPEEREMIQKRMELTGIHSISAYGRKMLLNGVIIQLDLSDLKEVSRLVRINANNLNQYVKRANETGSIYLEDIKEIKEQQEKIWEALKDLIGRLAVID